jgi:hypothetical protein
VKRLFIALLAFFHDLFGDVVRDGSVVIELHAEAGAALSHVAQGAGVAEEVGEGDQSVDDLVLANHVHALNLTAETAEVTFEVPDANTILVKGINKQAVGQMAAVVRGKRPPEPYLGKGIKYADERIRRKAGKTGK